MRIGSSPFLKLLDGTLMIYIGILPERIAIFRQYPLQNIPHVRRNAAQHNPIGDIIEGRDSTVFRPSVDITLENLDHPRRLELHASVQNGITHSIHKLQKLPPPVTICNAAILAATHNRAHYRQAPYSLRSLLTAPLYTKTAPVLPCRQHLPDIQPLYPEADQVVENCLERKVFLKFHHIA